MSASSSLTARPAGPAPQAPIGSTLIPSDQLDALALQVREIAAASRVMIAVPAAHEWVVRGVDGPECRRHVGVAFNLDATALEPSGTAACDLASPVRDRVADLIGPAGVVVPVGTGDETAAVILAGGVARRPEAVALICATAAGTAAGLAVARAAMTRRSARSQHRRSHWARELHDETLQELAAIRMTVERAASGRIGAHAAELLSEAIAQIDVATLELRRIVADLRPARLEAGGLREALIALADRCAVLFDLDVDYECDRCRRCGPGGDLDPDVEGVIYRVVQEALTNAIRHANASSVRIRVAHSGGVHRVVVRDDGVGFATGAVEEGFGITGMRERAALVRGTLEIASAPGEGTTVRLVVPERGALVRG